MRNSMDDLISRKAAIDAIAIEFDECGIEYGPNEVVHRVTCELKNLPTVNTAPLKHGRWKDNGNGTVSCSCCATWFQKEREPYMLYCGYCGARMDGGTDE